jgi:two-component system, NarL family, sensor kinase
VFDVVLSHDWARQRLGGLRAPSDYSRSVLAVLIFDAVYAAAYSYGNLGLPLGVSGLSGSAFWIPDAVLLSALVLTPPRRWWIYLLAIFPIRMVPALAGNVPIWLLLANYINDCLKALIAAALLRRFVGGTPRFSSLQEYSLYLGCIVLAVPVLSAFAGAAGLHALGRDYWVSWRNWFLGDALAYLVLAPAILLWMTDGVRSLRLVPSRRSIEAVLLSAGLILIGLTAFTMSESNQAYALPLLYVPIPFLLWAAVRFGPIGATSTLSLVAFVSILNSIHGRGPFGSLSPDQNVFSLQLFLAVIGVPLLFLAVLMEERHNATQAVEESEERYRAFFELNAVAAAQAEPTDGRLLRVNEAFCHLTGYTRDELLGMSFNQITHQDDLQASWESFCQLVSGAIPAISAEKRYVHKDGRTIWLQIDVTMVRNAAGEPLHSIALVQDVTDRRRVDEDLKQLSARLLQLQDEERRRIARELHDETAQRLFVINANLARLQQMQPERDSPTQSLLAETVGMGQQSLNEIRTLSYLLHPPLLDELGLPSALEWYVDGFSTRSGIDVELDVDQGLERLPAEVEIALFRVVQESLTNIHLHSGSERAAIRLSREGDRIRLEVTDQGSGMAAQGFSTSEDDVRSLGVGIPGMRQRLRQLGGQLDVASDPDGTTITAIVPIHRETGDGSEPSSDIPDVVQQGARLVAGREE